MSNNIKIIKDLIEKQKRDDERGATYGAGTALDTDTFPDTQQAGRSKSEVSILWLHG